MRSGCFLFFLNCYQPSTNKSTIKMPFPDVFVRNTWRGFLELFALSKETAIFFCCNIPVANTFIIKVQLFPIKPEAGSRIFFILYQHSSSTLWGASFEHLLGIQLALSFQKVFLTMQMAFLGLLQQKWKHN